MTVKRKFNTKPGSNLLAAEFLFPSMILIGLVNLYPILTGIMYSMKNGNVVNTGDIIGFANYAEILTTPRFWSSLYFSLFFSAVTIAGSYIIGLLLSLALNQNVPGRGFFRAAFIIPWVIPPVVSVSAWRWLIIGQNSLVNVVLGKVGIGPIMFLADPNWARFTVCMLKIWISAPFVLIALLASLQSISPDMYESASLETANPFKKFFYITMPHLRSISIIIVILLTFWSFNDFGLIYLLTNGGPFMATENVVFLSYVYSFIYNRIGPGSAIAVISLILMMILSGFMLKLRKEV